MKNPNRVTPAMIAESHRLQFDGVDYEIAAHRVAGHLNLSDDEMSAICSAPDPACNCDFCSRADWKEDAP
ncbi:MAG TPA: hypothetical protein VHH73_03285 [Verrucomicrobiae bacterium]|nr:hypothetical protein [Verrucomicrobiae bacterium]